MSIWSVSFFRFKKENHSNKVDFQAPLSTGRCRSPRPNPLDGVDFHLSQDDAVRAR